MINAPIAGWLDLLWEAVCLRAARPIPGILLDQKGISTVAKAIFADFLESGGTPEANLQAMLTVLSHPVKKRALTYVAACRKDHPDLLRDPQKALWEKNPAFPDLILRGPAGQLSHPDWNIAEPVLWHRAAPIYRRMNISENDARDVYAETVADFLRARPEETCPMRQMLVFEELPRLFAVIAERRAISWIRKQTTLKMQPNQNGFSLDDPDSGLAARLQQPRPLAIEDPLANIHFDQIRETCRSALSDFEWHLIEILFVEGNETREELIAHDWVLEELKVDFSSSRSTKLRRLNVVIADALSSLGQALEEVD